MTTQSHVRTTGLGEVCGLLSGLDDQARVVQRQAATLSVGLAERLTPVLNGVEATTAGVLAALRTAEEAITTARTIADGTFRPGGGGEQLPNSPTGPGASPEPAPSQSTRPRGDASASTPRPVTPDESKLI